MTLFLPSEEKIQDITRCLNKVISLYPLVINRCCISLRLLYTTNALMHCYVPIHSHTANVLRARDDLAVFGRRRPRHDLQR